MARLVSVVRWCGCGGWRLPMGRARQKLRRRHCGGTVWLGGSGGGRRRRRLTVSRLVRWRLVADLLRPIRKALMDMAAARRQLVGLPQLNFPFVGPLTLPVV